MQYNSMSYYLVIVLFCAGSAAGNHYTPKEGSNGKEAQCPLGSVKTKYHLPDCSCSTDCHHGSTCCGGKCLKNENLCPRNDPSTKCQKKKVSNSCSCSSQCDQKDSVCCETSCGPVCIKSIGGTDKCKLFVDPGLKSKSGKRWYYNYKTGSCKQFSYNGCNGNENNFRNKSHCIDTCKLKKNRDKCKLPADQGLEGNSGRLWYYDYKVGSCKKFSYKGCNGNRNKFQNETACKVACKPKKNHENCEDSCLNSPCCTCSHHNNKYHCACADLAPGSRGCFFGSCSSKSCRSEERCVDLFGDGRSYICKQACLEVNCKHVCVSGYLMDDIGCQTCTCVDPCEKCPKDHVCEVQSVDCIRAPCPRQHTCVPKPKKCKLRKCRPCKSGYLTDNDGCSTCECKPDLCAARKCPKGHVCELKPVTVCKQPPCSPVAECVKKPEKAGICPSMDMRLIKCAKTAEENRFCQNDDDCDRKQKCCHTGCSYNCVDPECRMMKCRRSCDYGYLKDEDGCNTCDCLPDPCVSITCQENEVCELQNMFCIRAPCPPRPTCVPKPKECRMMKCRRSCDYGYLKDEDGCNTCDCLPDPCVARKCPKGHVCELKPVTVCKQPPCSPVAECVKKSECSPVMCMMFCPGGRKKDRNGCDVCSCLPEKAGICPSMDMRLIKCAKTAEENRFCQNDDDCDGKQKCCHTGCSYNCVDPVCPEISCDNVCDYGYSMDGDGCQTCTCFNPCEIKKCDEGYECQVQKFVCKKAPCQQSGSAKAECVPKCSPMRCKMACKNGFKKDKNGCDICSCNPSGNCEDSCLNDPCCTCSHHNDEYHCACADLAPGSRGCFFGSCSSHACLDGETCSDLFGDGRSYICKKDCPQIKCARGCTTVKGSDGCNTCSCTPVCGPVCEKVCKNGYVLDKKGCPTCACNPCSAMPKEMPAICMRARFASNCKGHSDCNGGSCCPNECGILMCSKPSVFSQNCPAVTTNMQCFRKDDDMCSNDSDCTEPDTICCPTPCNGSKCTATSWPIFEEKDEGHT
jgi:hypothetical protein